MKINKKNHLRLKMKCKQLMIKYVMKGNIIYIE